MRGRENMRKNRNLQAILAAVAACGLATKARGQSYFPTYFDNASEVEENGPYSSPASTVPVSYDGVYGSTSPGINPNSPSQHSPAFSVLDISGAGVQLPYDNGDTNPYEDVVTVNPDLTLNFWDDTFAPLTSIVPITLSFFLSTDTATPINYVFPTQLSPLAYQPNGTATDSATGSTYTGFGLNSPGQTGSFASGSSLYFLGSGTYDDSQTLYNSDTIPFTYNLTIPSQALSYVAQQISEGGNVRIVLATNYTGTNGASFFSYGNTSYVGPTNSNFAPPTATFDLVTQNIGNNNNSTLFAVAVAGTAIAAIKNTSIINLGEVFQNVGVATTIELSNTGLGTAQYRPSNAAMGNNINANADGTVVTQDPVGPGGTANVTVGFDGSDTAFMAGAYLTAGVVLTNVSNSLDQPVTIEVTAHPIQERYIDSNGPSAATVAAPNFGNVLVGATVSMPVTVTTVNPLPTLNYPYVDYSTNSLNMETLLSSVTSHTVGAFDPFTNVKQGTFFALSPNTSQVFNNTQVGTVMATVVITASGDSGNSNTYSPGGVHAGVPANENYYPDLTIFENSPSGPETEVQGQGIPGEYNTSDTVYVYGQWDGFQTASLVSTVTSPLGPGGSGTLTNAVANDNTLVSGNFKLVLGQRATAWVTQVNFNQNGWGQTGLIPVATTGAGTLTTVTSGTTIVAPIPNKLPAYVPGTVNDIGAAPGTTATYTISQASSNLLNGTYTGAMSIGVENDQSIQGSASNDLPAVVIPLQSVYTGDSLNGSGSGATGYTLTGGTFSSSAPLILSGSYYQSGGTSTFASLSGGGNVTLAGGSLTMNGGDFTGSLIDNASLTVGGGASSITPTIVSNLSGTAGSLTLSGGYVQLGPGAVSFPGSTSNGATLLTVLGGSKGSPSILGNISGPGALAVGNALVPSYLQLAAGSHTSTVSGLTVSTNSILDINNDALAITYPTGGSGGSDPINSIVAALTSGYGAGGNWQGTAGILSSAAASGPLSPLLSVGYADGSNPYDASKGIAGLAPNEVLIKYTLAGDANLDYQVNFTDLLIVAQDFNKTGQDWVQGNFIYAASGLVNFADLLLVAQNFNKELGQNGTPLGSSAIGEGGNIESLTIKVPEPGSMTLMVGAAAGLLARRKRRRLQT
jgi:hypothetical protein